MKIQLHFDKIKGTVKPLHGIDNAPAIGSSAMLFHYLKEAGIPSSRLNDMGGMFGLNGLPLINADFLYNIRNYGALLVLLFIGATPVVKNTFYKIRENKNEWLVPVLCAIGLIISTAYLVDASYNPFLYFRF